MLDVMAGPHPDDPFSVPATARYRAAVDRPVDDLTVAYSPSMGTYPVADAVADAVDDAVKALADAGATVERVDPDLGHDAEAILEAYYTFARRRWNALFDSLESQGFDPRGDDRDRLRPYLVDLVLDADQPTAREYTRAQTVRTDVLDGLNDCFADHDLLATATASVLPFPHGEEPESVDGTEVEPYRGWLLTQPYNFTGMPAASVPAGLRDGLPVGLQIAGQRHDDATVIAASAAVERVRPWHDDYPA